MRRRRLVLVITVIVAGLTATGAVDPLPAPADDVELSPAGGNGEFASITDAGELRLDVERLNADARVRLAAVFEIVYTGSESTEVWVTDETDAIEFTAFASSVEGETRAVELAPGESVSVGLVVDVSEGPPTATSFDVNARVPDDNGDLAVTVEQSGDTVSVRAADVPPGDPVRAEVAAGDSPVVVRQVAVTTSETATVDLDVSTTRSTSAAPPIDVPGRAGEPVIEYVNVSHTTPENTIRGATFRFTVTKTALEARGLQPSDVTLYRFSDGEWNALPTTVLGETANVVRFQAEAPGLSVFAVAPPPAPDEPDVPPPTERRTTPTDATETPAQTTVTPTDPTETPATPSDTPAETTDATDTPGQTTEPPGQTAEPPTQTADTPSTTTQPTAEVFGFPLERIVALAALVALVTVIGFYRSRGESG